MGLKQRYEEELNTRIDVLTKEIHGMRSALDGIRANPRVDAPAAILLQANWADRERSLADLRRELQDVQLSNSRLMSENTRVIAADAMPTRPVKPKKTLNILVTAGTSLMLALFLCFFFEYVEKAKRKGHPA